MLNPMPASEDDPALPEPMDLIHAGICLGWMGPLEVWIGRWTGIERDIEADIVMPLAATLDMLDCYAPHEAPGDEAFARNVVALDYVYWHVRDEDTGQRWSPLEEPFLQFYNNREPRSVALWQYDAQFPCATALEDWLLALRRRASSA